MSVTTSSRWTFVLDLHDASLTPSGEDEALRLARAAESGTLGAAGEGGDEVQVQFDANHAVVLYMATGGTILRPHFPHRLLTGEGIEEFFCACCGVQLGDRAEMLSRSMGREEGFRLCRKLLRGQLPAAMPEACPDQLLIPGMEEFMEAEVKSRLVEWRRLQSRRSHSA